MERPICCSAEEKWLFTVAYIGFAVVPHSTPFELPSCKTIWQSVSSPSPCLRLGGSGIQHPPNVSDPRIFGAVSTLTHVYLYRINYQGLLAKASQGGYCGVGLSPTQRCLGVFSFGQNRSAMHKLWEGDAEPSAEKSSVGAAHLTSRREKGGGKSDL